MDLGKCTLQMPNCLFTTEELVTPSGKTKSNDENQKKSLKQLDPQRIKFILGK